MQTTRWWLGFLAVVGSQIGCGVDATVTGPLGGTDATVDVGGADLLSAGDGAGDVKAEVAARLTKAGQPPKVLTAGAVVGEKKATTLFEAAYDEHARRLAKLYQSIGAKG